MTLVKAFQVTALSCRVRVQRHRGRADQTQRFSQHSLYLVYETIFIAGSVLAGFSPGTIAFVFA